MPKATILDRLAGAMKTLSKREGKALTPRQRVAAAQRWNSLADIGEDEVARLEALADEAGNRGVAQSRYVNADDALEFMNISDGNGFRADNPFLSDNIDKYQEQSEFLDWCHYNGLEPNGRNLKTFRWERYKGMSVPQRERIYDNYDPYFLPEERMWYGKNDMPDYLPVGWDKSSNQARNRKLIEDAVRLRKEELWREYMEAEDPPPGIGWPTGKAEKLDEGFEEQARWDVQGMVNPDDNFWGITDDEFREKYKDAPWRLW